jgi:CDP-diacylglycerol---serine O-phosphatidyltransferase
MPVDEPITKSRPRLRRPRRPSKEQLRKGVYILPNLLTTGGMASGFYAIINAIDGDYVHAAWFIVLAAIFDLFDGRGARQTRPTAEVGGQ